MRTQQQWVKARSCNIVFKDPTKLKFAPSLLCTLVYGQLLECYVQCRLAICICGAEASKQDCRHKAKVFDPHDSQHRSPSIAGRASECAKPGMVKPTQWFFGACLHED